MTPSAGFGHGYHPHPTDGFGGPFPQWTETQHTYKPAASNYAPPVVVTHVLDTTLPTELLANPTFDYGALTIGVAKTAQDQSVHQPVCLKPAPPAHTCDVLLCNPVFEDIEASTPNPYGFHHESPSALSSNTFDRHGHDALGNSSDFSQSTVVASYPTCLSQPTRASIPGVVMHENSIATASIANPYDEDLTKDESARQSLEIFSANSSGLDNAGSDYDMKLHPYDDASVSKTLSQFLGAKPNPVGGEPENTRDAPTPQPSCKHVDTSMADALHVKLKPIRTVRVDALAACSPLHSVAHTNRPQQCFKGSEKLSSSPFAGQLQAEESHTTVAHKHARGMDDVDGELDSVEAHGAPKTLLAYQVASESFHAQRVTLAQAFAQSMHELASKAQEQGDASNGGLHGSSKDAPKRQKKTALAKMHDFMSGRALRKAERV